MLMMEIMAGIEAGKNFDRLTILRGLGAHTKEFSMYGILENSVT